MTNWAQPRKMSGSEPPERIVRQGRRNFPEREQFMETQKQAEVIRKALLADPDCSEIPIIFYLFRDDCVATVELFWSADEPDRRYLAIDRDMKDG